MFLKYLRRAKGSNQRGSLMVEAIAMLGLIAMVTPMLYKKAAERTTELEDINLANNARLVSRALDNYIKAYNEEISTGQVVDTSSCGGSSVNYPATFTNEIVFDVAHLCEFLPTGYVGKNKTFKEVKVSIKKYNNAAGNDVIGGAFAMKPSDANGLPNIRTSRIASMIGANGGFTSENATDGKAYGVQGAWEVDVDDYFSSTWKPGKGAIVVTAFNTGITDNKNYLYRNAVAGSPELNQMFTDLHMGSNDVHSVKRMIVGANNTVGGANDKIYIASGDIRVASGNANVSGNVNATNVNASALVSAPSGNFSNRIDVGASTDITGTAVSTGTLTSTGATTVGGTLTANGASNLRGNVTLGTGAGNIIDVNGTVNFDAPADFNSTANFDGAATFNAPATFNNTMAVNNSLTVRDNLTVNGTTTLGNAATSDRLNVNAIADFNGTANFDSTLTANSTATFNGNTTIGDAPTDTLTVNAASRFYQNAQFDRNILAGNSTNNFQVDNTTTAGRTGVYVRRGFVDTTNNVNSNATENYVRTHRMISDVAYSSPINGTASPNNYDRYEVNPAYTSVMKDIKLASRGGARLSEILPDFITKQIYVLDATYKHCGNKDACARTDASLAWTGVTPPVTVSSSGLFGDAAGIYSCGASSNCEVSEWLGFIPSPVCPENYSAIVTMSPLRWKMSSAHYNSNDDFKPGPTPVDFGYNPDQSTLTSPKPNPAAGESVTPLTYQTNTWLALTVESHCTSTSSFGTYKSTSPKVACSASNVNTFWGWSGVMGFIYPAKMFKATAAADEYIWNPFPVYNTELSATATVYCLFMRKEPGGGAVRWQPSLVETNYDQLRNFQYKGTGLSNNPRDPALGRTEDRTTSSEIGNDNQ